MKDEVSPYLESHASSENHLPDHVTTPPELFDCPLLLLINRASFAVFNGVQRQSPIRVQHGLN